MTNSGAYRCKIQIACICSSAHRHVELKHSGKDRFCNTRFSTPPSAVENNIPWPEMDSTLEIFDVKERAVGDVKPPSFPTLPATTSSSSATGFPVHKKRVSAFKKQRQSQPESGAAPVVSSGAGSGKTSSSAPLKKTTSASDEKRRIDQENKARLDTMSPEEIAEAQREIFNGLDPNLVQMLLRRANLNEQTEPSPFDVPSSPSPDTIADSPPANPPPEIRIEDASTVTAHEHDEHRADLASKPRETTGRKKTVLFDEDAPPAVPAPSYTETVPSLSSNATHFPHAPELPELDPNDPDFLESLHKKFFPNLPADPSKLAWMAPIPTPDSAADRESPYYPGQSDLPVSALRFDFHGRLLTPRTSRRIPVSKGLHHHGEAPEAAGYTIPELARLARSSVPGQRCLAYRTLGRMLYRLGQGEWGIGAGGRTGEEDDLAFALWRCFKEARVLESLGEEAAQEEGVGHVSSKAYAVEALWLFEKGGWKEKWRGV
ncbi:RPAP1-like protein [Apodospora peruviana]|uniref:RPAP1-like protein n=1 Tax=Apodospora peruviana TaxID=516989 RepID=A0AAE0M899_9PEZI|nr:RPAP1-like protein [Apodospora peruviana]